MAATNAARPEAPLPDDDQRRKLTVAHPGDPRVEHIFVAGDRYSILVSGDATAGRYCLIDMRVPEGGGPPLHRHDFEEMFTLLEGELEFTFRGRTQTVKAPATVHIPPNAPHRFRNASGTVAHMLCLAAPAGLDAFFLAIGERLATQDAPPPKLSPEQIAAKGKLAEQLSAKFRTEILNGAWRRGRGGRPRRRAPIRLTPRSAPAPPPHRAWRSARDRGATAPS